MPILATGQISIVDLSDGKSLSCYITSNLPKTQIYDPNPGGGVSPDWSGTPNLTLTPVVFANQNALTLNQSGLTITWKRKEGSGSESALSTGETSSGGVLTVSANKLNSVTSGLLTYLCYVTYADPETGLSVNVVADITFSQIKTAMNAQSAWISGEQLFKYNASGAVTPAQIELTANLANVTMSKWQYKTSAGAWADYPTTSDNASISAATLIVKPTHAIFNGDGATLRIVTNNSAVSDVISIYKVHDGATGTAGSAGASAPVVFLTNENITFAGNASGQVAAITKTCHVVAYRGTSKVTPTVGSITGAPTGMTVSKGNAANNEIHCGKRDARRRWRSAGRTACAHHCTRFHHAEDPMVEGQHRRYGCCRSFCRRVLALCARRHGVCQWAGHAHDSDIRAYWRKCDYVRRYICVEGVQQRCMADDLGTDGRISFCCGQFCQWRGLVPVRHDLWRQDLYRHHLVDGQDG